MPVESVWIADFSEMARGAIHVDIAEKCGKIGAIRKSVWEDQSIPSGSQPLDMPQITVCFIGS
jgi:hypothetical protein